MAKKKHKKRHRTQAAPRPVGPMHFIKTACANEPNKLNYKPCDRTIVRSPIDLPLLILEDIYLRESFMQGLAHGDSYTTQNGRYLCDKDTFIGPKALLWVEYGKIYLEGMEWLTGNDVLCCLTKKQAICFLGTKAIHCGCICNPYKVRHPQPSRVINHAS